MSTSLHSIIAIFLVTTLAGCETIYVAPKAGHTASFSTVYEPKSLHAVVQARYYPDGNSGFNANPHMMKNLGGQAVRGHIPTYKEQYQIPAGKDFHFGFHLISPGLITKTCTVNMRFEPQVNEQYEVVFSSFQDHCTVTPYQITTRSDGSVQRIEAAGFITK